MVLKGHEFTLWIKAIGIPLPTFQWYHGNTELEGKTDPVLTIKNFEYVVCIIL